MSYVQLLIHAVFRTKNSENTLPTDDRIKILYQEIWGIIENHGGKLYRINSMSDHVHILFTMPATISLSDFMRAIKASSSKLIKSKEGFEKFKSWSDGYAALSYSMRDKDMIINYIKNQQEHHKITSFYEEFMVMAKEMGIEIDETYWNM